MGSFGERLQREREMRSITLDEIADSTKISTRFLRALETEDFSKLPGGIFNKGFVRAYAKYLGIDEEQAVIDFVSAENGAQKPDKLPVIDPNQPSLFHSSTNGHHRESSVNIYAAAASHGEVSSDSEKPADPGARFMTFAIVLVLVLGVGGFGWKFLSARSKAQATSPVQQVQIPTVANAAPLEAASSQAADSSKAAPAETSREDGAKSENGKLQERSSELAVSNTPLEASAKQQDAKSKKDEPAASDSSGIGASAKSIRLNLKTKSDSWVSVKADGKLLLEGILQASTIRSFKAEKELVVKLGNASGVEVSYNGKNLPAFPNDAKTRTLTFSADGLIQQ